MKLLTGIDTAMPDVNQKFNYHATWNQHEQFWEEDFRQLASLGFTRVRWGVPWSLLQPEPERFNWSLLDPKVELAKNLGLEIFYCLTHFNFPEWLKGETDAHAVLAADLPTHLANLAEKILERHHFGVIVPLVEVEMDAFHRGLVGNWEPHLKLHEDFLAIRANLIAAFRAAATAGQRLDAKILCCEPASALETVGLLADCIDYAGIDYYPHMHPTPLIDYLRQWHITTNRPLAITEYDVPESFDMDSGQDKFEADVTAGTDDNRLKAAEKLEHWLVEAAVEDIPVAYGGWYPATGNIGWGYALTREREGFDCDRAGLIDLERQPDGRLKRVVCTHLVEEIKKLGN